LPWRAEPTPYRVIVSEFMLQQTQVERVVPIFERFVAQFPNFEVLAAAARSDVVRAWKGLGYNVRAVRLHELARAVQSDAGVPSDEAALRDLPGVGPYTARAIRAFAFNADVVAVDTNVRRIIHRTQFGDGRPAGTGERELDGLAATLVPPGRGFAFNSALMDLGAMVCGARSPKCPICPLRTRCAAAPFSGRALERRASVAARRVPFERTSRYLRGRIVDRLRALPANRRISLLDLSAELAVTAPHHSSEAISVALAALARDGLIDHSRDRVRLRS